jgi:hypothetical protein
MPKTIQPSFAAGEVSPLLYGRVDLAKYRVGLKTMLNFYVHPQGGASNRAGTQWVGEIIDSANIGRLIPFEFSTIQTYVLEFGDLKMRVIKDGGYVLEAAKNITAATQANPCVVTSAGHGYSNGDRVYVTGVLGMTQLNDRYFTVANVAANTFELSGVNSTGYTAYSSAGSVARVYTLVSPFGIADLPILKYEQSADTMTLTHPLYAPQKLTRTGHTSWTFTAITFAPTTSAPTAFASSAGPGPYPYAITAINDTTGEESLPLIGPAATRTSTITWTDVAGCSLYYVYQSQNGTYGFIGRSGTGATGFTDATITPDFSIAPPSARNPFPGASDYPSCTSYFDGRQWFANTTNNPQTIWGSASAAFTNMSVSQPTKDNDAITRTLASRQVNAIKHIVGLTNMIILTTGAEWKVSAGSGDVVTPAQFVARPQSYNGSSDIRPQMVNATLLYIPPSKMKVRTLQYEWGADTWTGSDVSLLASHLFETSSIVNWAYAKDPDSIIWGIRSDRTLLGFTYLPDQDVYAWHRHTTSNGGFEDVCVVREGNESAVYFVVTRTISGVTRRYVERLHTRAFTALTAAWFLDCAKEINTSGATVEGLWHLIGEEVYALADGIVRGPFTVNASGQITLPASASYKIVGKLYPSCEIETLPIEFQDGEGTMQGRKKRIDRVMVRLKNSADKGITVGSTGGQGTATLYATKSKDLVNPLATAPSTNPSLITEDMQTIPAPSIDWQGTVKVSQTQPLPITITAIMPDVSPGT